MILRSLILFFRFMQRDLYVYKNRVLQYVVNYALIYPMIHAFAFGYLQSNAYFSDGMQHMSTILFTGNFLIVIYVLTYKLSIELLFDIEGDKYINYQMTLLDPRLILIQKILFSTFFSALVLLPYFPVAKLLLGNYFFTDNINWFHLGAIVLSSSFMCSAYNHLAASVIPTTHKIGFFWRRVNTPLMTILGGFWVPWFALKRFSALLGYLTLGNPFIYVTEGIRRSILGTETFLPWAVSVSMLICFSIVMIGLTWKVFKRRMDHV